MKIFKNKYGEFRSGWSILLAFVLFNVVTIALSIIIGIIGGIIMMISGGVTNNGEVMLLEFLNNNDSALLFNTALGNGAFIFSSILLWKVLKKKKVASMGLTNIKNNYKEFIVGLLLGAITISIVAVILLFIGDVKLVNPIAQPNFSSSLLIGLIAFIFVGFGEEIFSRGYCMSMLEQTKNKYVVLLVPAAVFAALHLGNNGVSFLALINLFLVGVLFAIMFMKSKNIWMPIGYHITWNYFQGYIWGLDVSGNPVNGLYKIEITNPNLINGGAFGPEGGLAVTFIILLTLMFVLQYYKSTSIDNFIDNKAVEEVIS